MMRAITFDGRWTRRRGTALATWLVAASSACASRSVHREVPCMDGAVQPDDDGCGNCLCVDGSWACTQTCEPSEVLPVNRDVDVLFVVDNSHSMAQEQAALATSLSGFVDILDGVDASYRLGVTTTELPHAPCPPVSAAAGRLRRPTSCRGRLDEFVRLIPPDVEIDEQETGCLSVCDLDEVALEATPLEPGGEVSRRAWLERVAGKTNVAGGVSIAEAFACTAPQGITGCGFESPLEAMLKALESTADPESPSYGFLRSQAMLAVVVLTDELDCSISPVGENAFMAPVQCPPGETCPTVFWEDPDLGYPTSAACWNAGVRCSEPGPDYGVCVAEDYDLSATPGADEASAVLFPVDRYANALLDLEAQKRSFHPEARVFLSVVAGVPRGWPDAPIDFREAADPEWQRDYGVEAACEGEAGQRGIPPVRMLALADALGPERASVSSICDGDYGDALDGVARAIVEQFRPACVPRCAADTEPENPGLQPSCVALQEVVDPGGEVARMEVLPPCEGTPDDPEVPAGESACVLLRWDDGGHSPFLGDDLSAACRDEGSNLELVVVRPPGVPAPDGARVDLDCTWTDPSDRPCGPA
ncbi:MAG: VWA domain-containing protein [Deltaproteobacteria bacterium]|nr:MAG: VWA domain-containing protein [Deltaproteobacteria bacterium]